MSRQRRAADRPAAPAVPFAGLSCSRAFEETLRSLVIELSADGTDYVSHGTFEDGPFAEGWERLRRMLTDARCRLTRREILKGWPQDMPALGEVALWRWLDKAMADGAALGHGAEARPVPLLAAGDGGGLSAGFDMDSLPELPSLPRDELYWKAQAELAAQRKNRSRQRAAAAAAVSSDCRCRPFSQRSIMR